MKVVVIGGGLVGLATARALLDDAQVQVTVLEKESAAGRHQSTHNSGVLHAGLHYAPGTSKALLARAGIRLLTEYCVARGIAHEICGKLVVAVTENEIPRLRALHERGTRNGLRDLRWLSAEEARELEPHARCVAALHVPEEGIVDYQGVVDALVTDVGQRGRVDTGAAVQTIRSTPNGWLLETTRGEYAADFLINCAGLHVDRIARLAGEQPQMRIVPFRGEYYKLRAARQHLVRNLIYPVPDPTFPFLGVHFTRLIHGGIEAGPNAVLALAREGYRKTDFNPRDLTDALSFGGLWRFLLRYPRSAVLEVYRSLSKSAFVSALQRLVPELQPDDLEPGGAGVRAQALSPNGELIHDFQFLERPRAIHVLNAPSPAATACLAIGQEIAQRFRLQHARSA